MSESDKKEENIFQQQEQKKLETLSKETGIEVPVDSISLPSKGLLYPPEHPFHNCETVDIKAMSAKDEDILTSRALLKNGTVLTQLMKSCLINKAIDPDDLVIGDRNAILISIRVSGYGKDYDVKIECPECEEQFEHTFDLSQLEVKRLGVEPLRPNFNIFEFVLPISGLSVQFKLLTGRDELDITSEQEKKKKLLKTQIETGVTSRLFYAIYSIGGKTDRNEISRIVNNLRAGDARALRKYMQEIEPGVKMEQEVKCPHCGESSEVDIPMGVGFLYPDIK